jgi:hypothetical protein
MPHFLNSIILGPRGGYPTFALVNKKILNEPINHPNIVWNLVVALMNFGSEGNSLLERMKVQNYLVVPRVFDSLLVLFIVHDFENERRITELSENVKVITEDLERIQRMIDVEDHLPTIEEVRDLIELKYFKKILADMVVVDPALQGQV